MFSLYWPISKKKRIRLLKQIKPDYIHLAIYQVTKSLINPYSPAPYLAPDKCSVNVCWMKGCQDWPFFFFYHGSWELRNTKVRDNETSQPHGHNENHGSALEVSYLKLNGERFFIFPDLCCHFTKRNKDLSWWQGTFGDKDAEYVWVWSSQRAVGEAVWITEESIFRILHRGSQRCVKRLGFDFTFQGFQFAILFLYLLSLSGTESKPSRMFRLYSFAFFFFFKRKERRSWKSYEKDAFYSW